MSEFNVGDRVIVSQQLVNNAPAKFLTDGSVQSVVGQSGTVANAALIAGYILVQMDTGGSFWPFYPDELIKE